MIQMRTCLGVVDNSGAKKVSCIKVPTGFKRRYAFIGDIILVSVKQLRTKRKDKSKVKKGEMHKALIIRTKKETRLRTGDSFSFVENSVILLNNKYKTLWTIIFCWMSKIFRKTKFLKKGLKESF